LKTIFSPYLTTARLESVVSASSDDGWTLSREELATASAHERDLVSNSISVVLESAADRDYYSQWTGPQRIDVRSYAAERSAAYASDPQDDRHLRFLAGGRPVREKGFVELCRQFADVRDWAAGRGIRLELSILCRERRLDKGAAYIHDVEKVIEQFGLEEIARIEQKVPLDQLRQRMLDSTAIIVPSLYDPYGLMAAYAVEVKRPVFVSRFAGVSENFRSKSFVFDPLAEGDLLRAVSEWIDNRPLLEFHSCFPSYRGLYLTEAARS
jgi:glycosyltransferase involved in cell wall biosynthesis